MPKRKTTTGRPPARVTPSPAVVDVRPLPDEAPAPEVFVDVVFDHGVFHLAVVNGTDDAAYDVTVAFKPAFRGLGGTQDTSSLPLFRGIPFLAPRRRIETLLDRSSDYFQRGEPRRITATISWRNARQQAFTRTIVHDLGIYQDVTYVVRPGIAAAESTSRTTTPTTGRGDHGRLSG